MALKFPIRIIGVKVVYVIINVLLLFAGLFTIGFAVVIFMAFGLVTAGWIGLGAAVFGGLYAANSNGCFE